MGHDVHAALEQILAMPPSPLPPFVPETSSQSQSSPQSPHDNVLSSLSLSPKEYLEEMTRQGRYVQELWS
ncbi:hypothetical protein ACA910_006567 [Epithemia clementina (nom. ined.)]